MTDFAAVDAALNAAIGAYIDGIESVLRPIGNAPSAVSAELRRVRAAREAREAVLEFAEQHLDRAIEAARQRAPEGHKLAEIGAELDITPQAVGKRIRARGLDGERTVVTAAHRGELDRPRRAEHAALVRAVQRWPGVRNLRRLETDDGRVGFAPIANEGEVEWARPADPAPADTPAPTASPRSYQPPTASPRSYQPPAAPLDRRRFTDARDRALRGMAGADVFRADRVYRAGDGDTNPADPS